jgi:hypothetical protein
MLLWPLVKGALILVRAGVFQVQLSALACLSGLKRQAKCQVVIAVMAIHGTRSLLGVTCRGEAPPAKVANLTAA